MAETVAVIGGAGYIGSVLTPVLLEHGYRVRVLDNFSFAQTGLLASCGHSSFEVIRGDCRDRAAVERAIGGANYILPLAALVGAPICDADPIAATTVNLESIRLLLSLRSSEQRIVYPCTNSGYGIGEKNNFCTEDSALRPISLYGRTKVEAERAVLEAGNSISLRLATVFGVSPRMRLDLLVNDFVYRAVTDRCLVVFEGHFKRNYIHIRDVARAFLHAIGRFEELKNQPYNVGLSDANLSKLELCAKIKEQLPAFTYIEAPIGEDPDKRDYVVSNERIERTGFRPKYDLAYGIAELVKAYTIIRVKQFGNL